MELTAGKTNVISFSRETNGLTFNYVLYNSGTSRTDRIKDLGIFLVSKLFFSQHGAYVFLRTMKFFG
jgi:hypothetical protein